MGLSAPTTFHSQRSRGTCANVIHLRLAIPDEDNVRYVFTEWERDCGVKSNHEAQVNALLDRNFQRTVEFVDRTQQKIAEGTIKLALDSRYVGRRIPLANRGWPTVTAKPGKVADSAPVRHDQHFSPELWTLRFEGRHAQKRVKTIEAFRTLKRMADFGHGRELSVLWKLYGPTDPAANYVTFDRVAPIAHMTPTATELGARATRALRRSIAERYAAHRSGDENVSEWIAKRAEAERAFVEPREALRTLLARGDVAADRAAAIVAIRADCEKLVRKSATAFYNARDEVRSA